MCAETASVEHDIPAFPRPGRARGAAEGTVTVEAGAGVEAGLGNHINVAVTPM